MTATARSGMAMATSELMVRRATGTDLPHIAEIHVASWCDAYRGVIPDAAIDARTVESAAQMWAASLAKFPDNLAVAEMAAGHIAGFSCAGPVTDTERSAPYEFEVYALHVRPGRRRNGIGAALLHAAIARARDDLGLRSMIIRTLQGLHLSRRFYEREGGTLISEGHWTIGGVAVPDVAYGWDFEAPNL
jgi:GNAT superfamily N-acetyltransferase